MTSGAELSALSSFSERRRRRRQKLRQASNASDPVIANYSLEADTARRQLLLELFRVVAYYDVRILSIEPTQQWNIRQALGHGASFAVEQTGLPISSTMFHLRYRDLDVKGPDEAFYFVDRTRTKWAHSEVVAFKSARDRKYGFSELTKELRVQCHPPLQQHPHVVRLLGIAFVTAQDPESGDDFAPGGREDLSKWELQEIPLLVIEKAPYASLSAFLKSHEFSNIPSSLEAKLRLCADVLSAIEALHSCQILHGDVKCDNVLVFRTETSTGENWRAKITDFGHCELDIDDRSLSEDTMTYSGGTKYYDPPELACSPLRVSSQFFKSVDIWCWGMLFWEVMVNGAGFDSSRDDWLDDLQMQQLKENGLVLKTAKSNCQRFLYDNHHGEVDLFSSVPDALDHTLHPNPSQRQSAKTILDRLKNMVEDRSRFLLEPSRPRSMAEFPYFDITRLYYDLNGLFTIPACIYQELEMAKSTDEGEDFLKATHQMGLCRIVGFGIKKDHKLAMNLVLDAANGGHRESQATLLQLFNALGIEIPSDEREAVFDHSTQAAHGVSQNAVQDLKVSSRRRNNFHVESPEEYGVSSLHWATLLPTKESARTVIALLDSGEPIEHRTSKECVISNDKTIVDVMPPNTTAMDWAIIVDNIDALIPMKKKFESDASGGRPDLNAIKPIMTQLSYAAHYQSIRCLKHLLAVNRDEMDYFDARGFSSLYYAIRPNIFDRILRYQHGTEDSTNEQDVAPFMARQIQVIDALLTSRCTLAMHRQSLFNALHVTAAVGEHEVLKHLLQTPFFDTQINESSAFGWKPLKDAIIRGRTTAVDLLLKHNADTNTLWPAQRCHALHVCCLYQGSQSVDIAKMLLGEDSSALRHENCHRSTPLHEASQYGHVRLIELFLAAGARLLDFNIDSLTPLGLAIRFRFVLAVALLSSKHQKQKLPFQASNGLWVNPFEVLSPIVPRRGRYISALEYLLAPGKHSPSDDIHHDYVSLRIPLARRISDFGTFDIPFSESSAQIIKILVNNYEHRTRFGINLCLSLTHAIYRYDSGLHWAIRMANVDAIGCILSQQGGRPAPFKPDWRDLIELAYSQRQLGREHVGTEEAREQVISELREQQSLAYRSKLDNRTRQNRSLLLARLWRVYYRIYGHLEQREYDRANEWLMEARPRIDPNFLEFRQWYYPRFSLYYILFVILWFILIPMLTCYAIVARDPSVRISAANITYAVIKVILVNGLTLWAKAFRIACVFYDWAHREFPGEGWAMGWVQSALCLLFLALAIFDLWILNPGNHHLVHSGPSPGTNFLDGWNELDLPPWRREVLSRFQNSCQLLMAWIVLMQIIPPVAVIWTLMIRRLEMSPYRELKVDPDATIDPRWKKTYRFVSRVPASL